MHMENKRTDKDGALPKADRRGNTMLVPIGLGLVFAILAILWGSMASNTDRSSGKDVMTRPTDAAPATR